MTEQARGSSPQDDRSRGFIEFDHIPFEDITWGQKLGSGSFGFVYRGTYLGIDVALKEILPSTEYDVNKYFLREHTIMRECRHPNIVLFIGLCHAPHPDGRVFIVSEYISGGNLRGYIQDRRAKPFPWRLRISFAIDIARALAYLHARKCIHRDLKGENLLITGNERIKVTDFGFARIAARDDAEMKRMSYCGTDGYMSPEILLGFEFDERTDIFSLGIIFAEIISRTLVDNGNAFTRFPPLFTLEEDEVREKANKGCPTDWIELALHCTASKPEERPSMREVLERLNAIESVIAQRIPSGQGEHIGSIKITSPSTKIPRHLRNLFDKDPSMDNTSDIAISRHEELDNFDHDSEEDEIVEMLQGSAGRGHGSRQATTWRTARWDEPKEHKPTVMELFQSGPLPDEHEASHHLPGRHSGDKDAPQSEIANDTASTVTIRPFAAPSPSQSSVTTSIALEMPSRRVTRLDRVEETADSVYYEAQDTANDLSYRHPRADAPSDKDKSTPSVALPELTKPTSPTKGKAPVRGDIHRFTLVNQKALKKVEAAKAKKHSSFIKGLNLLISSNANSEKVKCAVCGRRIAKETFMQCDDCNNVLMRPSEIVPHNHLAGSPSQTPWTRPNPAAVKSTDQQKFVRIRA